LVTKRVCFLGFLAQPAHSAQPTDAEVIDSRPVNVFLSAHLAADDGPTDEVANRAQAQQTMQYARLADRLSNLSSRVARAE